MPGEPSMQGFAIKYDKPMVYKKVVDIPSDFKKKRVFLRFDGVYSYARLWVNGNYIKEHYGGFTRWESDITNMVSPGKKCIITLEVTDKYNDISYGSRYAKHCIGGILRDVTLYTLPEDKIDKMIVNTELDSAYTNGKLSLYIFGNVKDKAIVKFSLSDPAGKLIPVPDLKLTHNQPELQYSIEVKNLLKWDAEHPNLYTLKVGVWAGGKRQCEFSQKIGFRKIVVKGNQLFVNGLPVKLRGGCRHDLHPFLGRVSTAEYEKLDVQLAKEANINFIRTSHYPPTQRFVEYCNEMGIYLESESAVCFVLAYIDVHRLTEDSAAYTPRYLSQVEEMVSTLRNEPSVIIWSIGNESSYGINFQKSYDWIKKNDKSRPVIFSWPGSVPEGKKAYDLLSMHYPKYTGDLFNTIGPVTVTDFNSNKIPGIFDEWAPVPMYANNIQKEDPNIREFWGKSLDLMWEGVFNAKGGLGGAIWGMVDETFMLPDTIVGFGEWGIVDRWRRKKPEFWSTHKAYSPVRLLKTSISDFIPNQVLQIPVYNRFDHTWLNEVKLTYTYNGKTVSLICPGISPHSKGLIALSPANWAPGDSILLKFSRNNVTFDEYIITLGEKTSPKDIFIPGGDIQVKETADAIIVEGRNFRFPFSKGNGLLNSAEFNSKVVIRSGPYLNFSATGANKNTQAWEFKKISYSKAPGIATVFISGSSNGIQVQFTLRINGNGYMAVNYAVDHLPSGLLKESNFILPGLLKESGVKFILPESFDRLGWNREPYWSYYPEGDFGASKGNVSLYQSKPVSYRKKPGNEWQFDDRNFYYFSLRGSDNSRPFTNVAKSMKENIRSYQLTSSQGGEGIEVVSKEAKVACRVNRDKNQRITLYANTLWDYPEIRFGNYSKDILAEPHTGVIYFQLK
ncbi:MAG TPA: beta-galactosidase [Sphingobacteriaceae bacterium]|nr:beta-galactosidase [Sphingobacteriaceae bacterium]